MTWRGRVGGLVVRLVPHDWRYELATAKLALRSSGHFRSVREGESIDADGQPIPWYTYPATAYLDRLDLDGAAVFEWGLGNSTLYWERRGCRVTSVDDSTEWYGRITERVSTATLTLAESKAAYLAAISAGGPYDVVCVDGEHRDDCAALAPDHVAHGGLIVFDNSDRHPDALRSLRDRGWVQIDFFGLGPLNNYEWTTSLLLRAHMEVRHPDLPAATY